MALTTLVLEDKYRVVLTTPDIQKAVSYPITAADLNRKILRFRDVLQDPRKDPRPLAKELYDILIAPIAADLDIVKARILMWSLDSILRYVPMGALYDGKQYLAERYCSSVFTLASNARLKDSVSPTWRVLGLGVSKQHGDFAALPGVTQELAGIIRTDVGATRGTGVLSGTVALDEAFTEAAFKTALRDRYPLVHIASHFAFKPGNESDSFLLLGDGSHLTLATVRSLPQVFRGVELLTLSACDTASESGDGREVEGLGMLAQNQGAKAVLATLWPVSDASTPLLMQQFYRIREAQPGTLKIEALRRAQVSLLTGSVTAAGNVGERARPVKTGTVDAPPFTPDPKAPYAHPYYWAPFILIGNWK